MDKTRLETFSDGVIAIIITIMVLEMRTPDGSTWSALLPLLPVFLSYVLSFLYLGIYWNNHHHMMHATDHVDGRILWANLHLLFWLTLIPFGTRWMASNGFRTAPMASYGVILLMSAVGYVILQTMIVLHDDANEGLREAIGRDVKGKSSIVLYILAVCLAFVSPWIAMAIYILVALLWLVPDPRIEKRLGHRDRR